MSSTLDTFIRTIKNRKPRPKPDKKSHFTMNPLLFLAREVAIRRKGAPLDIHTVTKALVDELKYAHKHRCNVTCVIIGGPGKGKSKLAFLLGKMYTILTESEFEYCWDIDEIPDVLDGGWLHIDEWLIPEGKGRIIALRRVKNLFDTGRAKQISISVSTPTAPSLPFVSFEATTLAQDWDNRMNMFEIRVPLPRHGMVYIGNAIVPLGKDDDMWNMFDVEAKARKDRVWDEKGSKKIRSKLDTQTAAKEVMKWVKKNKFEITTKSIATTFVKTVAKEKKWDVHYYNEPDIVNWVMVLNEGTKKESIPFDSTQISGENWDWLRNAYRRWGEEAYALYRVPNNPRETWESVAQTLGEDVDGESLRRRVSRRLSDRTDYPPSTKELGDMGEGLVMASLPDTLRARNVGGVGQPDILCTVNDRAVALSVKLTETDTHYKERETHPEYDACPDNAFCILIIPRLLTIHVVRLTDSTQTINSRGRGGLATTHTPQEIGTILQEVVK